MSEKLIQSYILDKFFLSIIKRIDAGNNSEVYEACIWEWDCESKETGRLIYQDGITATPSYALEQHIQLCKDLIEGKFSEDKECPYCGRASYTDHCSVCKRGGN